MAKQQQVTVLGATGSIGQSTLDIIARHSDDFRLYAVTAFQQIQGLADICQRFSPRYAVVPSSDKAAQLKQYLAVDSLTEVLVGADALKQVSAAAEVDVVMAAIVGAAGLAPTLAAVHAGKRVLLANKEALVMSGELFIRAAQQSGAELLPVDSEHNAIFQCLPETAQKQVGSADLTEHGIDKILLTGSGGPFRQLPINDLYHQTPDSACKHPNWSMGRKISVDSATMLNKGLEYIEARWLFNCQQQQLEVIVHPQSVIHSMVQYRDGSVIAQLGEPDMRTPIAHCLGYPERIRSGVKGLDFSQLGQLTFEAPDFQRYPSLQLAIDCCWAGQAATTALNAANEVAVAEFLAERIAFGQIADVCDHVLQHISLHPCTELEQVLAVDEDSRRRANQRVRELA